MKQISLLTRASESSEWRDEVSRYGYRTIAAKMGERLERKSCM